MVHAASVAAAAAATTASSSRQKSRMSLTTKTSSYSVSNSSILAEEPGNASSPPASLDSRRARLRRQSNHKYHTFPTPPPKTPNEQPEPLFPLPSPSVLASTPTASEHPSRRGSVSGNNDGASSLPIRQLALLLLLSLSEQTALNSIQPYLPSMVESFGLEKVGMYVGLLGSGFALAQLATSFAWGLLSDSMGRKPIMLLGTALLAACFACFGFCSNFPQAVAVHVAMGLLNGNAAIVPTILGEITDRTNQSIVFGWLPVVYSLGGITGPALGGSLAGAMGDPYPYLAPNIFSAVLLGISVVVLAFMFEETLEVNSRMEKLGAFGRIYCLCGKLRKMRLWGLERALRNAGSRSPSRSSSSTDPNEETGLLTNSTINEDGAEASKDDSSSSWPQLMNRTTITILGTYLIFQLANISFNCLYPVFAEDSEPSGRGLKPSVVGVSLSVSGIATIFFQLFLFQPIKIRLGNMGMYRWAILGVGISVLLLPWVSHVKDNPEPSEMLWLCFELGLVLIIKNVCAVGGLSSAMLLITNSAPSNDTLGTINGVAQTLSAAGRSVGPFIAGSLYAATRDIRPKGEVISFCIFGGVAVLGWVVSLFIDGDHLESHDQRQGSQEGFSEA